MKLTVRTWKWMFETRSFHFDARPFRAELLLVSGRVIHPFLWVDWMFLRLEMCGCIVIVNIPTKKTRFKVSLQFITKKETYKHFFSRFKSPFTFSPHLLSDSWTESRNVGTSRGKRPSMCAIHFPRNGNSHVWSGLNFQYLHITGDGHQPNSVSLIPIKRIPMKGGWPSQHRDTQGV